MPIPWLDPELVARAKSVDLLSYLQAAEPHELVKSGPHEYRTKTHSSLVISRGMWIHNKTQLAGKSAVDYLIKMRGMSFTDAIKAVLKSRAPLSFSIQPPEQPRAPPEKRLILPKREPFPENVIRYLQSRAISSGVIRSCLDSGILYESRYHGTPVCVFIGKDDNGVPRFASMRGIGSDLKQDCVGSDKRFSFSYPDYGDARSLTVFEAPLDLLSYICLFPEYHGSLLSLGGTSDVALIEYLERNPKVELIALRLDNDDAGQNSAKRIAAALGERFKVTSKPPTLGKDYNEMLQITEQQHRHERAGLHRESGFLL